MHQAASWTPEATALSSPHGLLFARYRGHPLHPSVIRIVRNCCGHIDLFMEVRPGADKLRTPFALLPMQPKQQAARRCWLLFASNQPYGPKTVRNASNVAANALLVLAIATRDVGKRASEWGCHKMDENEMETASRNSLHETPVAVPQRFARGLLLLHHLSPLHFHHRFGAVVVWCPSSIPLLAYPAPRFIAAGDISQTKHSKHGWPTTVLIWPRKSKQHTLASRTMAWLKLLVTNPNRHRASASSKRKEMLPNRQRSQAGWSWRWIERGCFLGSVANRDRDVVERFRGTNRIELAL